MKFVCLACLAVISPVLSQADSYSGDYFNYNAWAQGVANTAALLRTPFYIWSGTVEPDGYVQGAVNAFFSTGVSSVVGNEYLLTLGHSYPPAELTASASFIGVAFSVSMNPVTAGMFTGMNDGPYTLPPTPSSTFASFFGMTDFNASGFVGFYPGLYSDQPQIVGLSSFYFATTFSPIPSPEGKTLAEMSLGLSLMTGLMLLRAIPRERRNRMAETQHEAR